MVKTQSVAAKIVEGAVWSSGSSLGVKVIGLVTTVIVIRILSVPEYGLYQLTLAAYGIMAAFFFAGFDQVVLADIMRAKGDGDLGRLKRLFLEFAALKLGIGVALFFISLLGANFADAFYGENIAFLVRITAFLFPIVVLERIINMLLNINLSFRAMSLFTFAEEAAKLVLVLFFSFVVGFGVQGIVLSVVGGSAIATLIFVPYGISLYRPIAKFKALSGRGLILESFWAYGKWAIGSKYLNDLQRNIRPWLIKFFVSTEAVGLFSLALNLYGHVVSLFPIGNVLGPVTAREANNAERVKRIMFVSLKYGTIFFVILGSIALIGVPIIVKLIFPQYEESIPLFSVLLLTIATSSAAYMFSSLFYGYREQRGGFFIMMFTIVFTLVAGPTLLFFIGIWGMVVEFVIGAYLFNILRFLYFYRSYPQLRIDPRSFFSWAERDTKSISSIIRFSFHSVGIVKD